MKYTTYIFSIILLVSFACKKEAVDGPVNEHNSAELDCASCPSTLLTLEPPPSTKTCDDFTDIELWPATDLDLPSLIGFSQDGEYGINFLEGDGFGSLNGIPHGIYGVGIVSFDMSSTEQIATFEVYGYDFTFIEMSVSTNGSELEVINGDFPMDIEGVTVDVDSITPGAEGLTYARVTLTGHLENVSFFLFETGITKLCVEHPSTEPPIVSELDFVRFSDFFNQAGVVLGSYPNAKTPLGYYGLGATNVSIDFDQLLASPPTRLGLVHAYPEGNSKLVNVQLPGMPLISTEPDSLDEYLKPYGYGAINYHKIDDQLWLNNTSPPISGAYVDSIIITGSNMWNVTLGANLQGSELRSVCSYYE